MKTIISSTLTILASLCFMSCQTENTPQETNAPLGAVDLGLSVYWGECNIGSTTPEGYGDHYAWGETETKNEYYENNYMWTFFYIDGTQAGYTKYYNSAGEYDKTVLDLEDDVAHVKLGGNWRMPTDVEFKELIENCTCTQGIRSGVAGYTFTSNINGASIFFPFAGISFSDRIAQNIGNTGSYWSSSLVMVKDNYMTRKAWSMIFYDNDNRGAFMLENQRFYARSVRPVQSK